ncbi:hypothetical protein Fmac_005606 [Flemingia macrophylla]|uniref:Ribosomal protein L2 n=1 Tax=Flemingia macrophylla TaxID=520843 RepID=A0ABD1N885_9FABA
MVRGTRIQYPSRGSIQGGSSSLLGGASISGTNLYRMGGGSSRLLSKPKGKVRWRKAHVGRCETHIGRANGLN